MRNENVSNVSIFTHYKDMYLSINGKSLVHLQLNSSKGLKNGSYFMDTHLSGKSKAH